ncbi:hypothetical protein CCM_01977 [Cordyceps militaris CM01]|uniref:Uncharacterized protein n=1 Tax=Cordyceps militaris (strain CM01) TaxID=983644 RepID=G3JBZ0_CORMM|nr:uncharacterized protein CCM_01977 [Cordyceps militaris CM01]EGX93708.1 hypothetical protein CCM_01977 [Cordyceps militaris CM01]
MSTEYLCLASGRRTSGTTLPSPLPTGTPATGRGCAALYMPQRSTAQGGGTRQRGLLGSSLKEALQALAAFGQHLCTFLLVPRWQLDSDTIDFGRRWFFPRLLFGFGSQSVFGNLFGLCVSTGRDIHPHTPATRSGYGLELRVGATRGCRLPTASKTGGGAPLAVGTSQAAGVTACPSGPAPSAILIFQLVRGHQALACR